MISSCPYCKFGRKFLSDDRDFPRLIENGKTLISNIHRYYTITLIQCSNCSKIWLFKGEPKNEKIPARGFYFPVDPESFFNVNNMTFTEFIDFCISELHSFKVGNFVEENINKFLSKDLENVINVLKTKREFPSFILDYILKWYEDLK